MGAAAVSLGRLVLLTVACAAASPAWSRGNRTDLQVTAVVREHLSLAATQPAELVVTDADIGRGFVDVPAATRLVVRSNSPSGYALWFEANGGLVREAVVLGLAGELLVNASGAIAAQPSTGPGTRTRIHELRFRFKLAPSARSGVHAWPLRMSVVPL